MTTAAEHEQTLDDMVALVASRFGDERLAGVGFARIRELIADRNRSARLIAGLAALAANLTATVAENAGVEDPLEVLRTFRSNMDALARREEGS